MVRRIKEDYGDYGYPEIAFCLNGTTLFEGDADYMYDDVLAVCQKPRYANILKDYCNSFGDSVVDDDAVAEEIASTFVQMVRFAMDEAESPEDFYIECGDRNTLFEVFYIE